MVGDSQGTAVTRTTLYSGEAGEAGEAGDAGDAGEAGEAGDAGEADEPPSQPHIGRYVVLRPLGRGGMGVVYLAYDDLLDRKVALKLIHTAGGSHTDGTARLLREAHALARLSHPNVVQIYEVGQHGQQVYLAMENLRGVTLRAWGETPRSWRAVLAVYRQAAAGLAAAHAAGLVHRDFKPDNAMIDDQDRVRVMDFGLARVVDDAEEGAGVSVAISAGSESISLTEVGVRLGTPAYMAPEQHLGCLTDARTDQFALCVALYEALYGVRPFVGDDRQSLAEQVVAGRLPDPPRGRVPAWLRRAVLRGLANDMDRRWPSMQALVTELERGQVRARFVIVAVVVVVVATLAIGAWTVRRREDTRRLDACVAAGASIAEVWNDSVRRRVHASLAATGLRYSASVADKALPWLDRYASAWSEARGAACLRAGVDASWDLETQARSLGCLDERRLALESLVDELAEADAGVAARAIQLAAGLDDVRPCLDAAQLAQQPRPPAELRGPLRAVQTQLARAYSLQGAGKGEAGLTAARKAQAGAEALAWPSLVAASRYRVGALLAVQGDYAGAEAQLEDAYFTALAAAAPPVLADAAIELMDVVGMRRERQVDAERWARFAAVTLRSLEPSEGLRTANYLDARAALRARADAHDEARALYARVLAIRERLLDPDHPDVAAAYHELANIDGIQGGSEAALTSYARALAIRERTLGPDSVEVAGTCHNMAILHLELGRHAEALAAEERALALLERARGSDHPSVGTCLNTLGNIRRGMGAPAEARALYTRAMDILTRKLGPDHSFVATSLYNLALLDLREGRLAAAHAGMRRAVEIRERALGPGNLMVASTLVGLGRIELALGELAAARTSLARALAITEPILGPDHADTAAVLLALAELALAEHHPGEATRLATRAVAVREHAGSPETLADARAALAAALWDAPRGEGQDRARARAVAVQARDVYRALGHEALARMERWLADHPARADPSTDP